MFKFIKEYYRKKLLREIKGGKSSAFLNINDVHTVGFVFEIESSLELDDLLGVCKLLKNRGVAFKGLVFSAKRDIVEATFSTGADAVHELPEEFAEYDICFVDSVQLNWVGAFERSVAADFFDNSYDLFISFNARNSYTLDCAAKYVSAKMSVGMANNALFKIVLESSDKCGATYVEYLNKVLHYLSVINPIEG